MERVADPVNGLPSRLNWLPTIAEIHKACEEIHGPIRRAAEWEAEAKRQLQERSQVETERERRPTYNELRAKYDTPDGPWGITTNNTIATRAQARADLIGKIGQAAFDALPDGAT